MYNMPGNTAFQRFSTLIKKRPTVDAKISDFVISGSKVGLHISRIWDPRCSFCGHYFPTGLDVSKEVFSNLKKKVLDTFFNKQQYHCDPSLQPWKASIRWRVPQPTAQAMRVRLSLKKMHWYGGSGLLLSHWSSIFWVAVVGQSQVAVASR